MKCPNCQAEVAAGAKFCGACGKPIPAEKPQAKFDPAAVSGLVTQDDGDTRQPSSVEVKKMEPGEIFAKRYEIRALIGMGGMGVVYRAFDKVTEREVALKLIRADRLAGTDAVKRLIREGVTSRDIRHPNVVAVYDVDQVDGQPYMSMEFISGKSLRAWNVANLQGPEVSMATAANIIREILAGLDAAHKAGVVHRDLKPENVMLLNDPSDQGVQLKILDFGIARAPNTGAGTASSAGTIGYMAPEQITAPDAAQPSADLFSLSVMFYELLVGVVPQSYWQPPSGGRTGAAGDRRPDPERPQRQAAFASAIRRRIRAASRSGAEDAQQACSHGWLDLDGYRSRPEDDRRHQQGREVGWPGWPRRRNVAQVSRGRWPAKAHRTRGQHRGRPRDAAWRHT
jgi:serine/threonine protein kinase